MRLLLATVVLFFATAGSAQAAHSVVLTWVASTDAQTGLTYNVYRVNAITGPPLSCPATLATAGWTQIANGIPNGTLTYTDGASVVVPGASLCYYGTAVLNSVESTASATAAAVILPAPPTGFTAVAH